MFNGNRVVGIIPARGGSKGLPRKNVLPLGGKPLIAWSIEQASLSSYVDTVVVTTDDDEIMNVARYYGAQVPFRRPAELATDSAKIADVIFHALDWLEEHRELFDIIVLLQPTSPLRSVEDINLSVELLFLKKAQAIVSVCQMEHHPYWSNVLPPDCSMDGFLRKEIINSNRQEFPTFYRLNGAVYTGFCSYIRSQHGFLGKETKAYIMPKERSIDIDTELDFQFADFLMNKSHHSHVEKHQDHTTP